MFDLIVLGEGLRFCISTKVLSGVEEASAQTALP